MKIKNLAAAIILLFSFQIISAQSNDKQIASIRAEYRAINKALPKYGKKTIDVEGISLEGTEATYYASGKGLKKIKAKIYGETYKADAEFYYAGEDCIFAFVKFYRYKGGLGSKVAGIEERRFYFSGGGIIQMMIGKKIIGPKNEKYAELKDGIIDTEAKLKEAYFADLEKE